MLLTVVFFSFAVRLITTPELGIGGDAITKWYNGKILLGVATGEWEWTHHTARFGVMLPMLIVQYFGGTDPILYYLPTFIIAALEAALLFGVAARLASPAFGFWVAIALVLHPQMAISGAQLLPGAYSGTYMLACAWCLLRHHEARDGLGWLLVAAASLFLAYLTKLSNVFFFPGVALALWSLRTNLRGMVCFWGALALLIGVEIGAYRLFTEYPLGRISIIVGTALPMAPLDSWLDLFGRYANLPWFWTASMAAYSVAAVGLGLAAARGRLDQRTVGVLWLPASFLVGLTFALRSIDPIIPSQVFNARYLAAGLPFFVLATALFVRFGLSFARLPSLRPRHAAGAAFVVAGLLAWQFLAHFPGFDKHPIWNLAAARATVADFVAGTPIVSADNRGQGARGWLQLFWDGPAPKVRAARFGPDRAQGFWYVLHDASTVTPQQMQSVTYDGEVILIESRHVPYSDNFGFYMRRGHLVRDDQE